jgi:hypothetical protein
MMETWKAIEGFPGCYVSDQGRVFSILRGGRMLKFCPDGDGYLTVGLWDGKRQRTKRVHKLVALAFVPNPLNLPQVNHKGKKSDNRATKLEWKTSAGHGRDRALRGQQGLGVHFEKSRGKYIAAYSPKLNQEVRLGRFDTRAQALAARRKAMATLRRMQ